MKAFISDRRELSAWQAFDEVGGGGTGSGVVAGGSSVCGFYLAGTRTAALCLASHRESV